MIPLHTPTRIEDREVLLVDDFVLSQVTDNLAERLIPIASAQKELPLYVDQQQVDTLAERYPNISLYGLWQTLIASGRIPPRLGLYQVSTTSQPHSQRYLLREKDGAHSGRLTEDALFDVFAPPALLTGLVVLDADPETLRLPAQPIQTLQTCRIQTMRERRHTLVLGGLTLLASLIATASADHFLHHQHTQHLQEAARLEKNLAQLQQELRNQQAGARLARIDQSPLLNQLLILARHAQDFEISTTSLLETPAIEVTVRAPAPLAPLPPRGLAVRHIQPQADGSLRLVW